MIDDSADFWMSNFGGAILLCLFGLACFLFGLIVGAGL